MLSSRRSEASAGARLRAVYRTFTEAGHTAGIGDPDTRSLRSLLRDDNEAYHDAPLPCRPSSPTCPSLAMAFAPAIGHSA